MTFRGHHMFTRRRLRRSLLFGLTRTLFYPYSNCISKHILKKIKEPVSSFFSSFRFGCLVLFFSPLSGVHSYRLATVHLSTRRKRARTRSTKKTGNVSFAVCDRLKIGFTSVDSANRRRQSSISRSTIPFRRDTSRRSRGNIRRDADMRRSRQKSTRRGNAFSSRCSLLCVSIALVASSARLVSGQRWVRVETMLVSVPPPLPDSARLFFISRGHDYSICATDCKIYLSSSSRHNSPWRRMQTFVESPCQTTTETSTSRALATDRK